MKPNDEQKPGFFDKSIVFDQLEASGTIAYHNLMEMGYPVKIQIAAFFQQIKPYLTPRHDSIKTIHCCQIFLLANGFLSKDFKLGETEIHFRSGNVELLNQIRNIGSQEPLAEVAVRFKERYIAFMRRVHYLCLRFAGSCEFLLIFVFASENYKSHHFDKSL